MPLLADRFLNEKDAHEKETGRFTRRVREAYEATMRRLLPRPWLVLFVVIVFLAMGWISYQHIGSGFMPSMDEGGFVLDYRSEPGTSLTETDRLLRQVEAVLRATPGRGDVFPPNGTAAWRGVDRGEHR